MKKTFDKSVLDDPAQLFFSFAGAASVESASSIPLTSVVPLPVPPPTQNFRQLAEAISAVSQSYETVPRAACTPLPRIKAAPMTLDGTGAPLAPTGGQNSKERPSTRVTLQPKEFITESRVGDIVAHIGKLRRPGQIKKVRVAFYPFRATLYSFKISKNGVAKVKFHIAFRQASADVFSQAADLMLTRRRADRKNLERAAYDQFVRAIPHSEFELPGARKARRVALTGPGQHRSLEESFRRVNEDYFHGQLEQPDLCWSPVRARRILGSYQERNDRLIISQLFDTPKVPLFVLDYLMYHELLHKFLGIGRRNDGKRCMHGKEFREIEKQFRYFTEATHFLKRL